MWGEGLRGRNEHDPALGKAIIGFGKFSEKVGRRRKRSEGLNLEMGEF